jgi:hypothetical protein
MHLKAFISNERESGNTVGFLLRFFQKCSLENYVLSKNHY